VAVALPRVLEHLGKVMLAAQLAAGLVVAAAAQVLLVLRLCQTEMVTAALEYVPLSRANECFMLAAAAGVVNLIVAL
jgi:hypothetical protein